MSTLISLLFFIVGNIVFIFIVSNIILIMFFARPFTRRLESVGIIGKNKINIRYNKALLLQFVILSVITFLLYKYTAGIYFTSVLVGYGFGLFNIFLKIRNFGLNISNFSDYFEANKRYFSQDIIEMYNTNSIELLKRIIVEIS